MIKLIKESNDNKHNILREDSIDDILEPQTYYIPDVWEDWKFDVAQAAERFGLSLDNLDYDNNSMTVIVTVDGYDRLGFEKYRKLYNWVSKNVYPEQDSYNFNEGLDCIKESYGDLSDYLERHLDSWYGRLNELEDAIEDLGLDVDEINNEYVVVHAAEPDGEDVYCKIRLGGTPRTISLETFEMLESFRRSKNVLRESDDKITAKSFQELISKLEDHGYSCEHYYDMKYPESNWLYITKNGDPYEAEFYRYDDGEYELYLHNIHPTRRRNESMKRKKQVKENFYRVWYNPYLLEPDEEDFIEVTAETEDEARRRVRSKGYVTSVEEIDNLTNSYDESKTRTKRNKLMEKSNFDNTQKAIDYYYPKWYYDDMSVNDIYDSLEKLGHSQDFIDAVIDGITDRYENEEDYGLDDYDECLDEANVVGMGGGYPNVYLPKAAKEYLKRRGFQEVNTEIGPCFYMRFPGNDVWEIYIDEQYGGIYVVQEGYELRPTDDIATIDDYDYKDDIDAVINLGNCLSNGEDFDSCLKAFF